MTLIVGLGNPGKKFEKTRHNLGFRIIDKLAENKKWRKSRKADCLYVKINQVEIIKPLTYMNNSGKSVKYIQQKHSINPEDIIVVHDDIDLSLNTIRISKNISSAGHKGVQSIIDELETQDFIRIRLGINPGYKVNTEKFVLEKFSKKEEEVLKEVIKKTIEAIKVVISEGVEKAQSTEHLTL